ncbi:MAG: hypothetical protein ACE5SW_12130 [Nitrososphaeraceae archaeon]
MKFSTNIILLLLVILTSNLMISTFNNIPNMYSAYAKEGVTPEFIKEIRENLLEVRLSLQKGDLIEALQHLNNVDEELLLLSSNITNSGQG